jgi:hypothetical protein
VVRTPEGPPRFRWNRDEKLAPANKNLCNDQKTNKPFGDKNYGPRRMIYMAS